MADDNRDGLHDPAPIAHTKVRVWVSIGAVAALGFYVLAPLIDKLSGTQEYSALSDRVDGNALILVVIAALPWLSLMISEFKAFGVEAKTLVEVGKKADEARDIAQEAKEAAAEARQAAAEAQGIAREAKAAAAAARAAADDATATAGEAKGAAAEARSAAGEASAAADMASEAAAEARAVAEDSAVSPSVSFEGVSENAPGTGDAGSDHGDDRRRLADLAGQYVQTRNAMQAGPGRTAQMTAIFTEMQQAARALGPARDDVLGWLSGSDSGLQLAAIAYLRAHPDAAPPSALVRAIGQAGEPFVQYWALRALSGQVDKAGIDGFSIADRERLRDYESGIRRGTDRHAQLVRLNQRLDRLG